MLRSGSVNTVGLVSSRPRVALLSVALLTSLFAAAPIVAPLLEQGGESPARCSGSPIARSAISSPSARWRSPHAHLASARAARASTSALLSGSSPQVSAAARRSSPRLGRVDLGRQPG